MQEIKRDFFIIIKFLFNLATMSSSLQTKKIYHSGFFYYELLGLVVRSLYKYLVTHELSLLIILIRYINILSENKNWMFRSDYQIYDRPSSDKFSYHLFLTLLLLLKSETYLCHWYYFHQRVSCHRFCCSVSNRCFIFSNIF